MGNIERQLSGGHPNSLGNTVEIVEQVLEQPALFGQLFECYFSQDEVVRLRVSSAMKRLCKAKKELLTPYLDRFLDEIAKIDQASTQWTLAILYYMLRKDMTVAQQELALEVMKRNLTQSSNWIVLNTTLDTLVKWSKGDSSLALWLLDQAQVLQNDSRKSVASKAAKTIVILSK